MTTIYAIFFCFTGAAAARGCPSSMPDVYRSAAECRAGIQAILLRKSTPLQDGVGLDGRPVYHLPPPLPPYISLRCMKATVPAWSPAQ
jgi:hypothetical protein